MRLFFDIQHPDSRCYDYHGSDYGRLEDATQTAELIAVGLGCSETDDCTGSQVQVRNAEGDTLLSVPILIAA
jgi:hypothetical protein